MSATFVELPQRRERERRESGGTVARTAQDSCSNVCGLLLLLLALLSATIALAAVAAGVAFGSCNFCRCSCINRVKYRISRKFHFVLTSVTYAHTRTHTQQARQEHAFICLSCGIVAVVVATAASACRLIAVAVVVVVVAAVTLCIFAYIDSTV